MRITPDGGALYARGPLQRLGERRLLRLRHSLLSRQEVLLRRLVRTQVAAPPCPRVVAELAAVLPFLRAAVAAHLHHLHRLCHLPLLPSLRVAVLPCIRVAQA